MSSPQGGTPDSGFQERLNRVAEARAPIDAAKPQVAVIPDWKENLKYPAAIVGSALVGMLAVFVARYVRFHIMGGSLAGDDADITMLIDGGIGAACGFLLFAMLRFEGKEFKIGQKEHKSSFLTFALFLSVVPNFSANFADFFSCFSICLCLCRTTGLRCCIIQTSFPSYLPSYRL